MNIFDLRGPEFLFVYSVISVVVLFMTALLRRAMDGSAVMLQSPQQLVSDPYLIAQLRGGSIETMRVVAMSLFDRGLLEYHDGGLRTKPGVEPEHARRPIERDVLRVFMNGGNAATLEGIKGATEPYEQQLKALRLLPDEPLRTRRFVLATAMLVIVGGIGVTKIFIGLTRGRPVLFLIILTIVSMLFVLSAAMPRHTKHGAALLADMRRLFAGLQSRAKTIKTGGATSELALLAAVFGVSFVPIEVFPLRRLLMPQASSSSSSSSSCGSSSSCSSSCGGGGCGGCGGGD
jgi:uncharacterized protein (TIGR04222 family)